MKINALKPHAYPAATLKSPKIEAKKQENLSFSTLTFKGKNKNQVLCIGAELPPFVKSGGVGTVIYDYSQQMENWISTVMEQRGVNSKDAEVVTFFPYYNGDIKYNRKTGEPTGKVEPWKIDGKPVFISNDVYKKHSMEDIINKKLYQELEEVTSQKMQWGMDDIDSKLFKVKGVNNAYMVFNEATARMPKPYADGTYAYSTNRKVVSNQFKGDPYAQFSKASVKTSQALKKFGFDPETILCSDAQTSFVPEYVAREILEKNPDFEGVKIAHAYHNIGPGYCSETSAKNMFSNFATKEQIKAVLNDPEYFEALKQEGGAEEYFKTRVKPSIDAKNAANPNMIPLQYLKNGNLVTNVFTVSEFYNDSVAQNPNASPGLHPLWKELHSQGKVGGILNGLDDPAISAYKPLPGFIGEFNNSIKCTGTSGKKYTLKPFKTYRENSTFEEMLEVKRQNKINLLERLNGDITDSRAITGKANREFKILGSINEKYVEMLKNGENVPVIADWGRADTQKGWGSAIKAIKKFFKTEEGKNAVVVMGGQMDKEHPETKKILSLLEDVFKDKDIKERFVFVDGFAPGLAFASGSDASLLPSISAPCELTDLEAAKMFSTPLVPNVEGMAQKNFDPRNLQESAKANAYKTKHGYVNLDNHIEKITKAFVNGDKEAKKEVMEEFQGINESVFEKFAKKYNKLFEEQKGIFSKRVDKEFLESVSTKALLESADYSDLIVDLKEEILSEELSSSLIERFKNYDNEIAQKIFKNQAKTNTTWLGNAALHPSGKSSAQLYVEQIIDPQPKKPAATIFNFDQYIKKAMPCDTFTKKQNVKTLSAKLKNSLSGKQAFLLAGIVGITASSISYYFGRKKTNYEKEKALAEAKKSTTTKA